MYKLFTALAFLIISHRAVAQVLPKEGSKLHYRLIGFSFPEVKNNSYTLQIAEGNYNTEDSFKKNIIVSLNSKKNKIVRLANTNCNALFSLNVPKNKRNVKMPHITR